VISSRDVDTSQGSKAQSNAADADLFALVYRQMRGFAGPSQDVDDLVQVALEQVYRGLSDFEGRSALGTWTHQICYRVWLKHRRWYGRFFQRFSFTENGQLPERPTQHLLAVDALEHWERARRLHAALESMSPKLRAVVTLHDLQGLGLEEVASIVSAPLLTVKSRLRDGRKALSRLLVNDPYFGDEAVGEENQP
jgi:RNA polymerase sigma-70 factor (ECF subfamily)